MKLNIDDYCTHFLKAARNQSAFDVFYYDFFNKSAKEYGYIPRPALWITKKTKFIGFFISCSRVVGFLWKYLAFFYFILKLIMILSRRKGRVALSGSLVDKLVLVVCNRTLEVVKQAAPIDEETFWLAVPNFNNTNSPLKCVSAQSVLTFFELLKAFYITLRVHLYLIKENDPSVLFQSYTALDWIVTYMALNKINPGTLVTAEHHDRWAVLLDTYCEHRKKSTQGQARLILVQHGLEFTATYEKMAMLGYPEGLPYKLENLNSIYTYNSDQFNIFKCHILKKDARDTEPLCMFYEYKLRLSNINSEKKTLLIVGNTLCEDFHLNLLSKLSSNFEIDFFYKPHPVQKSSDVIVNAGWFFIEDKEYYPAVDLVVSYPSTLVNEYRTLGVTVIEHDFQSTDFFVDELIHTLENELRWKKFSF